MKLKDIKIPDKENIFQTSDIDPVHLKFGYYSKCNFMMMARLKIALDFIDINNLYFENILEVGYGSGILIPELTKRLKEKGCYYGIDTHPNKDLVYKTVELEKIYHKVILEEGSILSLPYTDSFFDCVLIISVLEHLFPGQLENAIKEISRVSRKDAKIIIGFPTRHIAIKILSKINHWDFDNEHKSCHSVILNAIEKYLQIIAYKKFPSFFPVNSTLYLVALCAQKLV